MGGLVAILISGFREDWLVLEYQRDTVASFFPNCSVGYFPDFSCCTNITFVLFDFSVPISEILQFGMIDDYCKCND